MSQAFSPTDGVQAVILCGGRGERLGELTVLTPKPLLEIGGHPFLKYQLDFLFDQGIRDFLFLAGYHGNQIEHFASTYALNQNHFEYKVLIEPKPLGTGGALLNAKSSLKDNFFLINGDTFLNLNYAKLIESLSPPSYEMSIAVYSPGSSTDQIETCNISISDDCITHYEKSNKTKTHQYVDAGVGAYRKTFFRYFSNTLPESFSLEEQIWPLIIADKKAHYSIVTEPPYDIGTTARIQNYLQYLQGQTR